MDKNKIQDKLKKLKALAERGVGGEKETAEALYKKLIEKYELSEELIEEEEIDRHWFRYDDFVDNKLLCQIFYKVTGNRTYWVKTDKRRRLIGVDCTNFELDQILFYYQFYKKHLQSEIEVFISAFFNVNDLFPDESARCYDNSDDDDMPSIKDLDRLEKMLAFSKGINKKTPNLMLEDKDRSE